MSGRKGRTGLTDDEYRDALRKVLPFVAEEGRVTNSRVRWLTGLNYDQVIKLFNRAVEEGSLLRKGRAAGTHYVLPGESDT